MSHETLAAACAHLSQQIDPMGHENRRWAREEGAVLKSAVEWSKNFFLENEDFEAGDVPAKAVDTLALDLKYRSTAVLIATVFYRVSNEHLLIWAKPNQESGFYGRTDSPESTAVREVDEDWVTDAIGKLIRRITFQG